MRKPTAAIKPSEITPEIAFHSRREILSAAIALALLPSMAPSTHAAVLPPDGTLGDVGKWAGSLRDPPNSYTDITSYNNYYEFGTDKGDPARYAHTLKPRPWSVQVTGEAAKLGTYTLEDILAPHALEERIYRFRCVEAWSMVVPWVGFPLGDLLSRFEPTSRAKYVQFFTLADPKQMPGLSYRVLEWPYREGLTIEEAMHPLTLLTVGVYGKALPNQNGAPLRVIIPWKYGFKSAKSIVRIHFTEQRPQTSWNMAAPQEYGFYSNVNPEVDHPRWSQASERRLGGGLFATRVPTLMFNGYTDEVASLYAGLDLRRNY
ncbi:MAG TPA: protein-methionine-sulfoxide reductase catalytic subunit MsrP [Gammaproteobacteria bacterium]|jgi:sulfoxide reductase catalytic subunit YedY